MNDQRSRPWMLVDFLQLHSAQLAEDNVSCEIRKVNGYATGSLTFLCPFNRSGDQCQQIGADSPKVSQMLKLRNGGPSASC